MSDLRGQWKVGNSSAFREVMVVGNEEKDRGVSERWEVVIGDKIWS